MDKTFGDPIEQLRGGYRGALATLSEHHRRRIRRTKDRDFLSGPH
jgi:hypothetical protein